MMQPMLREVTVRSGSIITKVFELRERINCLRIFLKRSDGVLVPATSDVIWSIDSSDVVGLYIQDEV